VLLCQHGACCFAVMGVLGVVVTGGPSSRPAESSSSKREVTMEALDRSKSNSTNWTRNVMSSL
jgi:hypothetical protein